MTPKGIIVFTCSELAESCAYILEPIAVSKLQYDSIESKNPVVLNTLNTQELDRLRFMSTITDDSEYVGAYSPSTNSSKGRVVFTCIETAESASYTLEPINLSKEQYLSLEAKDPISITSQLYFSNNTFFISEIDTPSGTGTEFPYTLPFTLG